MGVGDDAGRVAAVRAAAGPDVAIRVDANGAWSSVGEALANLRALAPSGIEYAEEPVHGIDGARRGPRRTPPCRSRWTRRRRSPGRPARARPTRSASRSPAAAASPGCCATRAAARTAGSEVYVASSFDGPLGIAAGLHAAAALAATRPVPPCGLATLGMFEGLDGVLAPRAGAIAVPAGPGLL